MKNERKVSIRAYAKALGVDEKTVRNARNAGLLRNGYDAETGLIIPSVANQEWGNSQLVAKRQSGRSTKSNLKRLEAKGDGGLGDTQADFEEGDKAGLLSSIQITPKISHQEAARYREIIGAGLDKMKLAEAEGRLVARDKVEKALFALGSELKKALLNIPQRVVRDIMTATNEVEGINILTDEITAVLSTYGNMNKDTF